NGQRQETDQTAGPEPPDHGPDGHESHESEGEQLPWEPVDLVGNGDQNRRGQGKNRQVQSRGGKPGSVQSAMRGSRRTTLGPRCRPFRRHGGPVWLQSEGEALEISVTADPAELPLRLEQAVRS